MKLSSRKQLRPRERLGACRTCDRTSGRNPLPDPPGIPAPATLRSHSPRLADLGQEWVARGFLEGSCQWRKDGHRRAPALRGRQCSLRFLKTSAVFPGGLKDCLGRGFDNEKMPANPSGKMRSSKEKSSKASKDKRLVPGVQVTQTPPPCSDHGQLPRAPATCLLRGVGAAPMHPRKDQQLLGGLHPCRRLCSRFRGTLAQPRCRPSVWPPGMPAEPLTRPQLLRGAVGMVTHPN